MKDREHDGSFFGEAYQCVDRNDEEGEIWNVAGVVEGMREDPWTHNEQQAPKECESCASKALLHEEKEEDNSKEEQEKNCEVPHIDRTERIILLTQCFYESVERQFDDGSVEPVFIGLGPLFPLKNV